MIRRRVGRILATAAATGVCLLAVGVSPASAAPSMTLSQSTNLSNSQTITVNFTGFASSVASVTVAQCLDASTPVPSYYTGDPSQDCINATSKPVSPVGGAGSTTVVVSSKDNHNNPCDGVNIICDINVRPNFGDLIGSVFQDITFAPAGVVPESPIVFLLPLGGLLLFGGYVLRRRRHTPSTTAA